MLDAYHQICIFAFFYTMQWNTYFTNMFAVSHGKALRCIVQNGIKTKKLNNKTDEKPEAARDVMKSKEL